MDVSLDITITPENLHNPDAYVEAVARIQNSVLDGSLPSVEAKRITDLLKANCADMTGVPFDEVTRDKVDPLLRFKNALDMGRDEIEQLISAVKNVDEQRASASEKKRIIAHLRKVLKLQDECRADPAKFFVYLCRNADDPARPEKGHYAILNLEWFHCLYFDVWTDPHFRNSLIQAPPGHGKTTALNAYVCWQIGDRPTIRILWLSDQKDKANKEIRKIKRLMKSKRYRAIFPDIRIMTVADDQSDSTQRFTVVGASTDSREPTLEGYSILSSFNGAGYDMVIGDDFCSPDVRHFPKLRADISEKWASVVEERLRNPATSQIKIIHTPWHKEDTCGLIIRDVENGRLRNWRVEVEPFKIRDDKEGRAIPIWPGKFDADYLEQRKIRLGPVRYACNYKLSADVREEQLIKKVNFYHSLENSPLTTDHDRQRFDRIAQAERWLSIDPSASTAGHSSYQGVIEGVVLSSGHGLVTGAWSLKLDPVAMQDWIVDRIATQPSPGYHGVLIEAQGGIKGQVSLWKAGIEEKLAAKKIKMPLFVTTNTITGATRQHKSKLYRLSDCAGMIQEVIYFAGQRKLSNIGGKSSSYMAAIDGSEIERLIKNMQNFHTTDETDGVDALVQWVYHHRHTLSRAELNTIAPTQEAPTQLNPLTAKMQKMMSGDSEEDGWLAEEMEFITGKRSA